MAKKETFAQKRRQAELKKQFKPVKCPICGQAEIVGPRAMSMHVHLAHKNLDELRMQKAIAEGVFGIETVKRELKRLESGVDENEVASAIRKYYALLKAAGKIGSKKKAEKADVGASGKKKSDLPRKIHPLDLSQLRSKLENAAGKEKTVLGLAIRSIGTWRFVKDVVADTGSGDLNIIMTKKSKLATALASNDPEVAKTVGDLLEKPDVLTVYMLLAFLDNHLKNAAYGERHIYINTKGAGGAKLVKVEKDRANPGLLLDFEYDEAYYDKEDKK